MNEDLGLTDGPGLDPSILADLSDSEYAEMIEKTGQEMQRVAQYNDPIYKLIGGLLND